MTKHDRYNATERGRERWRRYYETHRRTVNLARATRRRTARVTEIKELLS